MTDTKLLEQIIKDSGMKKKYIAELMGLSPYGLSLKIDNKNAFTAPEISKLCKILKIKTLTLKERIFFAHKVDEKSTEEVKA